jgi:hypothetical protein
MRLNVKVGRLEGWNGAGTGSVDKVDRGERPGDGRWG